MRRTQVSDSSQGRQITRTQKGAGCSHGTLSLLPLTLPFFFIFSAEQPLTLIEHCYVPGTVLTAALKS